MEIRHLHPARYVRGFTLLELMITLSVALIVLMWVIPSFAQLLASTRITTAINEFLTDIHLARNETIKRGKRVAICPSGDGSTCLTSRGWPQGWIVFVDDNEDNNHNPAEEILRVHGELPSQMSINPGRRARVAYAPDGTLAGGFNGTYEFCDSNKAATPKAIIISLVGRPRVSLKRSDGTPLHCP